MSMIHHGMMGHSENKKMGCEICATGIVRNLDSQLAVAKAEIESLVWLARHRESEITRLRAALENIKKHTMNVIPSGYHLSASWRIAQSALDGGKA